MFTAVDACGLCHSYSALPSLTFLRRLNKGPAPPPISDLGIHRSSDLQRVPSALGFVKCLMFFLPVGFVSAGSLGILWYSKRVTVFQSQGSSDKELK